MKIDERDVVEKVCTVCGGDFWYYSEDGDWDMCITCSDYEPLDFDDED